MVRPEGCIRLAGASRPPRLDNRFRTSPAGLGSLSRGCESRDGDKGAIVFLEGSKRAGRNAIECESCSLVSNEVESQ